MQIPSFHPRSGCSDSASPRRRTLGHLAMAAALGMLWALPAAAQSEAGNGDRLGAGQAATIAEKLAQPGAAGLGLAAPRGLAATQGIAQRIVPRAEALRDRLDPGLPASLEHDPLAEIHVLRLAAVSLEAERRADEERIRRGRTAHFAAVRPVEVNPWTAGTWSLVDESRNGGTEMDPSILGNLRRGMARWQLRIHSPGARSLSLAFRRLALPPGARLAIGSEDGRFAVDPFGPEDVENHGRLWTPPVAGDRLLLELFIPVSRIDELDFELFRVHHGYAGFGADPLSKSGGCHADPACLDSERWHEPARSVGLVSIEGVRYCTGFLINNTAQDGRPLFVTASHCGARPGNAESVVVMWNFEKPACDAPAPTAESRYFQTGARVLATHRGADLTLLELDERPDPRLGLVYAGWDRSEADPLEAFTIHHPNTDRKRVAFTDAPVRPSQHLERREQRDGNHLYVPFWSLGSTEGGSSGAPLFNGDHRVVGLLHGGYAACGNQEGDWFGRLGSAWHGHGPTYRLRDWLDPVDSQVLVLDALAPEPARAHAPSAAAFFR